MSVKETIKSQITGALQTAKFPINTLEELLDAFPEGADTKCKAEEIEMTAAEAGKLLSTYDFPFKNAEEVAETITSKADL